MSKTSKKITFLTTLLSLLVILFSNFFITTAYADDSILSFDYDTSSIIEDITGSKDSSIDYSSFDTNKISIVKFIVHNGIYIYVYNPTIGTDNEIKIDSSHSLNKIQMSYAYGQSDVFENDFNKYNLKLLAKTESEKLLKYKVLCDSFHQSNGYDSGFYSVSGIELFTPGQPNATEYPIATTYNVYYGNLGTKYVNTSILPTIPVDVTHTFYRTTYSDKGNGWNNQISSCFFTLPKYYSTYAGKLVTESGVSTYDLSLEAVTAEFNLKFTKPMLVIEEEGVYNEFSNLINVKSADLETYMDGKYKDSYFLSSSYDSFTNVDTGISTFFHSSVWNRKAVTRSDFYNIYAFDNEISTFNWLFKSKPNYGDISSDDFYVPMSDVLDYYHKEKSSSKYLDSNLFEYNDFIANEKISLAGFYGGYNKHTYSLSNKEDAEKAGYTDDVFNYTVNSATISHKKWDFLGIFDKLNVSQQNVKPLQLITYDSFKDLSKEDFCDKYFINVNDYQKLYNEVVSAGSSKEVWVLRYDATEYFASTGSVWYNGYSKALLVRESAYLDWDILSFRYYQKANTDVIKRFIIGGTHSPEDVIGPLEPPNEPPVVIEDCSSFKILGVLILLIIIFIFYLKITPLISKRRKHEK